MILSEVERCKGEEQGARLLAKAVSHLNWALMLEKGD